LKYAVEQGCPIDVRKCLKHTFGECKKYLENLMNIILCN